MAGFQAGAFWRDVLAQDPAALPGWFAPGARIHWPCTNERFTVAEYVRANCAYPGQWDGQVERELWAGDTLVTVARVFAKEGGPSFHVTGIFRFAGGKIAQMDEYWADDGPPPLWRQEMGLGEKIV